MIIQNLEKKIRTVTIVTVTTVVVSACLVAFTLYSAFSMVCAEQRHPPPCGENISTGRPDD